MSNDSQTYNPTILATAHPDCIFQDPKRKERARSLLDESQYSHLPGSCILYKGQTRPSITGNPNFVQKKLGFAQIESECPARAGLLIHYSWLAVTCSLNIRLEAVIQEELRFLLASDIETGMGTNVIVGIRAKMKSLTIVDQHNQVGANILGEMRVTVVHEQTNDIEIIYTGAAHRKSSSLVLNGSGKNDWKIDDLHSARVKQIGNFRQFYISLKE